MMKHVTCHIDDATKKLREKNRAALNHHGADSSPSQSV
jgi:hypothetical protein